MMEMIRSDQQDMDVLSEKTRISKAKVAAYYRDILTALQQAHAANPQMVPQHLLINFESNIPKQARGRPPTIKEPTKDKKEEKRLKRKRTAKDAEPKTKHNAKDAVGNDKEKDAIVNDNEKREKPQVSEKQEPQPEKKQKYTLGTTRKNNLTDFFNSFKPDAHVKVKASDS